LLRSSWRFHACRKASGVTVTPTTQRQPDCTSPSVGRVVPFILLTVSLATADATVTQPRHAHPYRDHWKHSTFGKRALGGVAARAGVGQLAGHPRNYGGGAGGFGKRLGAGFATHSVKTTVEHAVAAPLHEDLDYHRSSQRGFGHRLGHALKSTVITRNTRSGKRQPAVGKLSGHAAAGAVSQAALHAGSGAATAGVGLAGEAGANVAREFWPRHKGRQASARTRQ
jgi:hypothetical protein